MHSFDDKDDFCVEVFPGIHVWSAGVFGGLETENEYLVEIRVILV